MYRDSCNGTIRKWHEGLGYGLGWTYVEYIMFLCRDAGSWRGPVAHQGSVRWLYAGLQKFWRSIPEDCFRLSFLVMMTRIAALLFYIFT